MKHNEGACGHLGVEETWVDEEGHLPLIRGVDVARTESEMHPNAQDPNLTI